MLEFLKSRPMSFIPFESHFSYLCSSEALGGGRKELSMVGEALQPQWPCHRLTDMEISTEIGLPATQSATRVLQVGFRRQQLRTSSGDT